MRKIAGFILALMMGLITSSIFSMKKTRQEVMQRGRSVAEDIATGVAKKGLGTVPSTMTQGVSTREKRYSSQTPPKGLWKVPSSASEHRLSIDVSGDVSAPISSELKNVLEQSGAIPPEPSKSSSKVRTERKKPKIPQKKLILFSPDAEQSMEDTALEGVGAPTREELEAESKEVQTIEERKAEDVQEERESKEGMSNLTSAQRILWKGVDAALKEAKREKPHSSENAVFNLNNLFNAFLGRGAATKVEKAKTLEWTSSAPSSPSLSLGLAYEKSGKGDIIAQAKAIRGEKDLGAIVETIIESAELTDEEAEELVENLKKDIKADKTRKFSITNPETKERKTFFISVGDLAHSLKEWFIHKEQQVRATPLEQKEGGRLVPQLEAVGEEPGALTPIAQKEQPSLSKNIAKRLFDALFKSDKKESRFPLVFENKNTGESRRWNISIKKQDAPLITPSLEEASQPQQLALPPAEEKVVAPAVTETVLLVEVAPPAQPISEVLSVSEMFPVQPPSAEVLPPVQLPKVAEVAVSEPLKVQEPLKPEGVAAQPSQQLPAEIVKKSETLPKSELSEKKPVRAPAVPIKRERIERIKQSTAAVPAKPQAAPSSPAAAAPAASKTVLLAPTGAPSSSVSPVSVPTVSSKPSIPSMPAAVQESVSKPAAEQPSAQSIEKAPSIPPKTTELGIQAAPKLEEAEIPRGVANFLDNLAKKAEIEIEQKAKIVEKEIPKIPSLQGEVVKSSPKSSESKPLQPPIIEGEVKEIAEMPRVEERREFIAQEAERARQEKMFPRLEDIDILSEERRALEEREKEREERRQREQKREQQSESKEKEEKEEEKKEENQSRQRQQEQEKRRFEEEETRETPEEMARRAEEIRREKKEILDVEGELIEERPDEELEKRGMVDIRPRDQAQRASRDIIPRERPSTALAIPRVERRDIVSRPGRRPEEKIREKEEKAKEPLEKIEPEKYGAPLSSASPISFETPSSIGEPISLRRPSSRLGEGLSDYKPMGRISVPAAGMRGSDRISHPAGEVAQPQRGIERSDSSEGTEMPFQRSYSPERFPEEPSHWLGVPSPQDYEDFPEYEEIDWDALEGLSDDEREAQLARIKRARRGSLDVKEPYKYIHENLPPIKRPVLPIKTFAGAPIAEWGRAGIWAFILFLVTLVKTFWQEIVQLLGLI